MRDDANTRSVKSEGTAADERIVRLFRPRVDGRAATLVAVTRTLTLYRSHREMPEFAHRSSVDDLPTARGISRTAIGPRVRIGYLRLSGYPPVHRSRLLLEQVLEDQRSPALVPRVHKRATLFKLPEIDGGETELFGEGRHQRCGTFVVA